MGMSDSVGCARCARFCVDLSFEGHSLVTWIVENEVGKEGGDLCDGDMEPAPGHAGLTGTFKCVSCGQVFTVEVGVGPALDVWGNRTATWKAIPHTATHI